MTLFRYITERVTCGYSQERRVRTRSSQEGSSNTRRKRDAILTESNLNDFGRFGNYFAIRMRIPDPAELLNNQDLNFFLFPRWPERK